MSESKMAELSKNGLQMILEEDQKEIKGIFQVLEYTEKKNMNNQIFDVTLSDGFSKTIAGFLQINEFLEGINLFLLYLKIITSRKSQKIYNNSN